MNPYAWARLSDSTFYTNAVLTFMKNGLFAKKLIFQKERLPRE